MYDAKNHILLINSNLSNMTDVEKVKNAFINKINRSNLSQTEKDFEINLANRAFLPNAIDLDVIRREIGNTKYYKFYAFLAGHTSIPSVETVEALQVNAGIANFLGNLSQTAGSIIPGISQATGVISSITGTSTSCGIIGSLFGTKKCKDKVAAQQGTLIKPAIAVENPVFTQPQPTTLNQQLQEQGVKPKDYPLVIQDDKPISKSPKEPGEKGLMDYLKEYWYLVAIAVWFLFFSKQGKKMFK